MKIFLMASGICAMLFSIATTAHSAEGLYIGGNIGAGVPVDSDMTDTTLPGVLLTFESDTGVALGVALGYDFGNNFRTEIEYAYQQNDLNSVTLSGVGTVPITSGNSSSHSGLLNAYYDFNNDSAFTPFITAGAGFSTIDISDIVIGGVTTAAVSDTVFAYQVGAGVSLSASDTVSIDLTYRYFATANPEFTTTTMEYSSHNLYVGARVGF